MLLIQAKSETAGWLLYTLWDMAGGTWWFSDFTKTEVYEMSDVE